MIDLNMINSMKICVNLDDNRLVWNKSSLVIIMKIFKEC